MSELNWITGRAVGIKELEKWYWKRYHVFGVKKKKISHTLIKKKYDHVSRHRINTLKNSIPFRDENTLQVEGTHQP